MVRVPDSFREIRAHGILVGAADDFHESWPGTAVSPVCAVGTATERSLFLGNCPERGRQEETETQMARQPCTGSVEGLRPPQRCVQVGTRVTQESATQRVQAEVLPGPGNCEWQDSGGHPSPLNRAHRAPTLEVRVPREVPWADIKVFGPLPFQRPEGEAVSSPSPLPGPPDSSAPGPVLWHRRGRLTASDPSESDCLPAPSPGRWCSYVRQSR